MYSSPNLLMPCAASCSVILSRNALASTACGNAADIADRASSVVCTNKEQGLGSVEAGMHTLRSCPDRSLGARPQRHIAQKQHANRWQIEAPETDRDPKTGTDSKAWVAGAEGYYRLAQACAEL